MKVVWIDLEREPQKGTASRAFPEGIDIDASKGASKTCRVSLPYPAARCGYYVVSCESCGLTAIVSTSGRRDDPRSIRLPCKRDERRITDQMNAVFDETKEATMVDGNKSDPSNIKINGREYCNYPTLGMCEITRDTNERIVSVRPLPEWELEWLKQQRKGE